MSDCDRYEVLVSAWLDGELERAEQRGMLDHLMRCARCRDFYLEARALSGLLAVAGAPAAAEQPSPEVWERIERSALSERSARDRGRGRAPWPGLAWARRVPIGAFAAAAAVLLVVLAAYVARPWSREVPPTAGTAIRIGDDAGRMNDARFVELTTEVLRADRRYRAAFYEVMRQVAQDTADNEASVDLRQPEAEKREETNAPETRRSRT